MICLEHCWSILGSIGFIKWHHKTIHGSLNRSMTLTVFNCYSQSSLSINEKKWMQGWPFGTHVQTSHTVKISHRQYIKERFTSCEDRKGNSWTVITTWMIMETWKAWPRRGSVINLTMLLNIEGQELLIQKGRRLMDDVMFSDDDMRLAL